MGPSAADHGHFRDLPSGEALGSLVANVLPHFLPRFPKKAGRACSWIGFVVVTHRGVCFVG